MAGVKAETAQGEVTGKMSACGSYKGRGKIWARVKFCESSDMRGATRMLERYLNNPDQYVKQKKAFDKVYKKLYG